MPAQVRIDQATFRRLVTDPNGKIGQAMRAIGAEGRQIMREEVGVDTGNLRDRIVHRTSSTGGTLVTVIGVQGVPYAVMHHQGTRPHIIRPRRAGGRLVFVIDGRRIFARQVNHPGTEPNPYLHRTLARLKGRH